MPFVVIFLVIICFLLYFILDFANKFKKIMGVAVQVNEQNKPQMNYILSECEQYKKLFENCDSIKNMDEEERINFSKYVLNYIYAQQYSTLNFLKGIYSTFSDSDTSSEANDEINKHLNYLKSYTEENVNVKGVIDLINELNLKSANYEEKILINNEYYIAYYLEETEDCDNRRFYRNVYRKITIVNEDNIDLLLEYIKSNKEPSCEIYIEIISKYNYLTIKDSI